MSNVATSLCEPSLTLFRFLDPWPFSLQSHKFSPSLLVFFLLCSLFPLLLMKSQEKDHQHHHHHHHNRLFNFHLHMRHEKGGSLKPPKGLMGIRVGIEGEEEQQRFMVPVEYLKHPLFMGLLNEAEREYGFDHLAAITIPYRVDYFPYVLGIIDHDSSADQTHHHQHHPWPTSPVVLGLDCKTLNKRSVIIIIIFFKKLRRVYQLLLLLFSFFVWKLKIRNSRSQNLGPHESELETFLIGVIWLGVIGMEK